MGRWLRAISGLLLLLLQVRLSQQAATATGDILVKFAAAARGLNSHALPDWGQGADPCSWTGVICSASAVVGIKLPRAGLKGFLAADLAQLSSLQQINLAGNQLTGQLPASWAKMKNLERLYLDSNELSGPLPPSWNTMESIQYMSLSGNRLNGTLPMAWSSLSRLYLLDLSNNTLSGSLPSAWSRQRTIMTLSLAHNSLSGSLPKSWSALQGLLQLDLAGNSLRGELPAEWGALQQASSIDVSRNQLTGGLPAAWGRMASLQVLSLQGNQLTGAVPSEWAALADRAYRISLGGNSQLCGKVPQTLAQAILVAGNSRAGSHLASACSWEGDASALLAFKAGVTGSQLQGSALADWLPAANPCSAGAWTGITCHDGRVAGLDLGDAGLTLSSLEPLDSLTALHKMVLAGNNLQNAILPASWAGLQHLELVNLSNTGIFGSLPAEWQDMRSLKQLLLKGNSLDGTLPASWAAMTNLTILDVSQNALTGGLPSEWATLASLTTLDASSNYLSGPLPDSWKDLTNLQQLQLANNNLAGAVPASWSRLPALAFLSLASNVGICGGQPAWQAGAQVHTEATNIEQSCIMVNTSGTLAGVVLGVSLSLTLASLAAVGAMLVFVQRQRTQLQLLQRERSFASFTSFQGAAGPPSGAKLATVHTFSLTATAGTETPVSQRVKNITIPNPWDDERNGYIQVPLATPHSGLPISGAAATPRSAPAQAQSEHFSPSPKSCMPSPERKMWQVAAHAAERGIDLTARRSRQKRLFRNRSDAPSTAADAATDASEQCQLSEGQHQQQQAVGISQDDSELEVLRVHSRISLLPHDGSMV